MRIPTLTRRLTAAATAAAVLLSASACARAPSDRPTGRDQPRHGAAVESDDPYDEANLRYGMAPVPHPDVTYQPDVVLVGGGGRSVRSVTADGLTWRIDPDADHAGELAPGKVMFLTGRAVGRVLDVRREVGAGPGGRSPRGAGTTQRAGTGTDLAVTIGPVDITEVIRKGRFTSDQPIPLDQVVAYPAGEPFWADTEATDADVSPTPSATVTPSGDGAGGAGPGGVGAGGAGLSGIGAGGRAGVLAATAPHAVAPPAARSGPTRPPQPAPQRGGQVTTRAGGFAVTPTCCAKGVGAEFRYDKDGVRLVGSVALLLKKPRGTFDLDISDGRIQTARFRIQGGAGLRLSIAGATKVGADHNINRGLAIPVDFTVPLGTFLGVPFSATVSQTLTIQTVFSSKDGNIEATAEYGFDGALAFGYDNGRFGASAPTSLTLKTSLMDTMSSVSMGVTGLIAAYQAKFHVGIGAFGFRTGLYLGLTTSVGITAGSAAGSPIAFCQSVTLTLWLDYGVGYKIPTAVAKVINFFLRIFDAKPIAEQGGIGDTALVLTKAQVEPDVPICRK
ncbi:hypothetical protein [Actinopolymorpha alba]|uniref:hypothetical protein n=1 Tax=Actinopolymorpha alba TaxID=533267 RepID=UPI0003AA4B16|nr:hypothetical protein [Actinopolymorpha alba]